jgi:hypothetical protein
MNKLLGRVGTGFVVVSLLSMLGFQLAACGNEADGATPICNPISDCIEDGGTASILVDGSAAAGSSGAAGGSGGAGASGSAGSGGSGGQAGASGTAGQSAAGNAGAGG